MQNQDISYIKGGARKCVYIPKWKILDEGGSSSVNGYTFSL